MLENPESEMNLPFPESLETLLDPTKFIDKSLNLKDFLEKLGAFFSDGTNHYNDDTNIISNCVPQILLKIQPNYPNSKENHNSNNLDEMKKKLEQIIFPAIDACVNWLLCRRLIITWMSHITMESYGQNPCLFVTNPCKDIFIDR